MINQTNESVNVLKAQSTTQNARFFSSDSVKYSLMDILQEHLVRARSSGGVFAKSAVLPPWGIALPGSIQLTVHMVLKGRAYLWTDDHSKAQELVPGNLALDRKSTRLNSSHTVISYAVFCLKKKKRQNECT